MKMFARTCVAAALLFPGATVGWAHTFLIETRISASRNSLDELENMRVVGIESGVMDTLFDNGHIFFNVYSSSAGKDMPPTADRTMALAAESGANYLLEIVPDEGGAAWRLRATNEAAVHRSYEEISQIEEKAEIGERWVALGAILGTRMMDLVTGN